MFHKRKSYSYVNKNGKLVYVPDGYFWRSPKNTKSHSKNYTSTCPECGATIVVARNKRGGWAFFEDGLRTYGTLHACFTRGRGMSKLRPENMDDLFEELEEGSEE